MSIDKSKCLFRRRIKKNIWCFPKYKKKNYFGCFQNKKINLIKKKLIKKIRNSVFRISTRKYCFYCQLKSFVYRLLLKIYKNL